MKEPSFIKGNPNYEETRSRGTTCGRQVFESVRVMCRSLFYWYSVFNLPLVATIESDINHAASTSYLNNCREGRNVQMCVTPDSLYSSKKNS